MCGCMRQLTFTTSSLPQIKCHGPLSKKLDLTESGKRSSDRSWKAHYAVLAGNKLIFYKDKRDAVVVSPCNIEYQGTCT